MARPINPLLSFYNVVRATTATTSTARMPDLVLTTHIPAETNLHFSTTSTTPTAGLVTSTLATNFGPNPESAARYDANSGDTAAGIWTLVGLLIVVLLVQAIRWMRSDQRRQSTRTESRLIEIEEDGEDRTIHNMAGAIPPPNDYAQPIVLADVPPPNFTLTQSLSELNQYSLSTALPVPSPEDEPECIYATPVVPSMPIMTPTVRVQLLDEILRAKYFQRRVQSEHIEMKK